MCTYFAKLEVKNNYFTFTTLFHSEVHHLVPRVSQGGKKSDPGNEIALARRRFFTCIGSLMFTSLVFDLLFHSVKFHEFNILVFVYSRKNTWE